IDQTGAARTATAVCVVSVNRPAETGARARQKSGRRPIEPPPPVAVYVAAERMPFFAGSLPVATAVQTGAGWVGRNVARCSDAPPSSKRPKRGRRPSGGAGEKVPREG